MSFTDSEEALIRQLLANQASLLSLAGNETTITSKLGSTKGTLSDLIEVSSVASSDLLLMRQGTADRKVSVQKLINDYAQVYLPGGSGAVARTYQDKLREIISVEDFRADTDTDTQVLAKAFSHMTTLGGGTLVFPVRRAYNVLWDFDIYGDLGVGFFNCKGLRIIGNGSTINTLDGARCGIHDGIYKDEGYGLFFFQCEDVFVTGLRGNGNKANANYGTADGKCIGIFHRSCKRFTTENCLFENYATDDGYGDSGIPHSAECEDGVYIATTFSGGRRQAFSGCGMKRTVYYVCNFLNAGNNAVGTPPMSGYDFEPVAPARQDDTVFIACRFAGNKNTQIVADSAQQQVGKATFISCEFDCEDLATALAIWCKNPNFVFRDCVVKGVIQFAYGKFYNVELTVNSSNSGLYAIDHNTNNQGMLWEGGSITVSGGKRVFNLQGSATSKNERKIIRNAEIYLDGTDLASGTFWAIHRNSTLDGVDIYLTGTPPASPFYLSNTDGRIKDCESFSSSVTLGTTSSNARAASGGLTPLRFSMPAEAGNPSVLTIAAGAINIVASVHRVDTESLAATDGLVTINGGYPYQRIILFANNIARTVVIKHNAGNILLSGQTDKSLDNSADMIELMYEPISNKWVQLSFSDNGA